MDNTKNFILTHVFAFLPFCADIFAPYGQAHPESFAHLAADEFRVFSRVLFRVVVEVYVTPPAVDGDFDATWLASLVMLAEHVYGRFNEGTGKCQREERRPDRRRPCGRTQGSISEQRAVCLPV